LGLLTTLSLIHFVLTFLLPFEYGYGSIANSILHGDSIWIHLLKRLL
jgi:hypothetical protein